MKNYIFGYGSLIEKASRLRTTPNAEHAFPVIINGYVRGWWARTGATGFTTTFLGCIAADGTFKKQFSSDHVNGVVYEVSEEDLRMTDEREKGYKRVQVKYEAINDYTGVLAPDDLVWVYLSVFKNEAELDQCLPTASCPIVQSYVDICINGCMEIETLFPVAKQKGFAVDFIRSTQCWSGHWANDRIYPRRPFIYSPNAEKIDGLLKTNLKDGTIFDSIYIE